MEDNTQKMTKQDMDAWLNTVDESRVEVMTMLFQISKGYVDDDMIKKLQMVIPMCFDAVAILGPARWQKILDLHTPKDDV
jgi:hypothetical protein